MVYKRLLKPNGLIEQFGFANINARPITITLPVNYINTYKAFVTTNNETGIDRFVQTQDKQSGSFKILMDATNAYADWETVGY